MKAIEFKSVEKAEIVEVERPVPGDGELLIRLKTAGICHSDIMSYEGLHPYRIPPIITGHEAAGVVEAAGENVSSLKKGDRVAIEPHGGCGVCEFCIKGDYNVCPEKKLIGVGDWTGTFAEYFIATEEMCHKMPDQMSFETGAMLEPYCVGLHAVQKADIFKGATVAILGCGTIGMMTLLSVRQATEASQVIISDLSVAKRSLAPEIGADMVIDPRAENLVEFVMDATDGRGVDFVFQTAPDTTLVDEALQILKRQGKLVMVALLPGEFQFDMSKVQLFERELVGTAMYNLKDYQTAIEQWRAGKLENLKKLVSNRITLDQGPEIIDGMANKKRLDDVKNIINID